MNANITATRLELSRNLDKLPHPAIAAIALALSGELEGLPDAYMIEVRLDDPMGHIISGGEGLIVHNHPNRMKSYAYHLMDDGWAVVHKDDKDFNMLDREKLDTILKKYIDEHTLEHKPCNTDPETSS